MSVILPGKMRRIPHGAVPIFTADQRGDLREGLIRVPEELTHSLPFTEKRRKFDDLVKANIKIWGEWLARKGWILNSKPKVFGPFDPPSKDSKSRPLDEGMKWYYASAYFKRDYALFIPSEADQWFKDEAKKYGEPTQQAAITDSAAGTRTVKNIINPELVDPLVQAAERRERLGIKPDDWTQQPIGPDDGAKSQVV